MQSGRVAKYKVPEPQDLAVESITELEAVVADMEEMMAQLGPDSGKGREKS